MMPSTFNQLNALTTNVDKYMRTAIDLVVIGGYLGAGKTTLLNQVLSARTGKRIAVLVNDFGSINIDAALIRSKTDDVINLENGCICCSIGDSLTEALIAISARENRPDILLIEASGVSDPAKIAQIGMSDKAFRLCAIAVLVDAENSEKTLHDPYVGDIARRQIAGASVLVLTKLDLISDGKKISTKIQLSAIAKTNYIIDAKNGQIPLEFLFDSALLPDVKSDLNESTTPPALMTLVDEDTKHLSAIRSFNFNSSACFDKKKLKQMLSTLSDKILRAKGIVWLTQDTVPYELHVVGSRIMLIPFAGKSGPISTIVFIGLINSADERQMIDALQQAVGAPQLSKAKDPVIQRSPFLLRSLASNR